MRVDPLAGARPPSRLAFHQVSKHWWVLFLAPSGDQSTSFWNPHFWLATYSHLSGGRVKSSSAHILGAELFLGSPKSCALAAREAVNWCSSAAGDKLCGSPQVVAYGLSLPMVLVLQVLGGHSTQCVLHASAGLTLRWEGGFFQCRALLVVFTQALSINF